MGALLRYRVGSLRGGWAFRVIVFAAVFSMLAPGIGSQASASRADWPQLAHGPSHTGYHPFETGLSPTTVAHLTRRWQRDLTPTGGLRGEIYAAPVVARGLVFTAPMRSARVHGVLWALDADTGRRIWRSRDLGTLVAAPAVSGRTVVVNACYPFEAVAFDARTGETLWRHRTTFGSAEGENYQGAAPVLAHDIAVVSTTGFTSTGRSIGRLWAFDLAAGEVAWTRPQTWTRPAINGKTVYAGRAVLTVRGYVATRRLLAIDLRTGSVRWRWRSPDRHAQIGAPSISDDMVYTSVWREGRDSIVALSATTGRIRWRARIGRQISPGSPMVVTPYRVIAETLHGRLVALRRDDGARSWVASINRHGAYSCTEGACASPAAANGVVFAIAGKRIRAFRLQDGTSLWSRVIGDTSYSRRLRMLNGPDPEGPARSSLLPLEHFDLYEASSGRPVRNPKGR